MIAEKIKEITSELPQGVKLVAVSKFHPAEAIKEAYDAGQRIFGESRVQELEEKHNTLPQDIEWHFIGHLQTNKVKFIVPYVAMIHGIDSFKLLAKVDKEAETVNKTVNCLLQIHIAQEETKFGLNETECRELLLNEQLKDMKHIRICGLMGMASNTDNLDQVRREFAELHRLFKTFKAEFFAKDENFKEISMGMSHDYPEAISAGSTLIRVGSKIFGERNYN